MPNVLCTCVILIVVILNWLLHDEHAQTLEIVGFGLLLAMLIDFSGSYALRTVLLLVYGLQLITMIFVPLSHHN